MCSGSGSSGFGEGNENEKMRGKFFKGRYCSDKKPKVVVR